MGEGKTVFTTTEWNSLQTNGVSFQVKVEANEGIWVTPDFVFENDCFNYNVNMSNPQSTVELMGFYGGLQPGETSNEGELSEKSYDARCTRTSLVLPSTIKGHTVETITNGAFIGDEDHMKIELTSITIPSTIKFIRSDAFSSNNLTNVTIPINVLEVGEAAFSFNPNLTSVTFEGRTCSEIIGIGVEYNDHQFSSWEEYGSDYSWTGNTDAVIYDGSGNVCYNPNA